MGLRLVSLTVVVGACLGILGTAAAESRPPLVSGAYQPDGMAALPVQQVVGRPDPAAMRLPQGTTAVPGRVLVRFRQGVGMSARSNAVSAVDGSVQTAYQLVPRLELLRLPAGTSVASAVAAFSRDPRVEYAVPDIAVKVAATPSDPLFSSQWALPAIGAPQAWDRTTGSAGVTVAVLDTGVQLNHPDLAANLVPGWNFLNNTNDPSDTAGHGTLVSGIIGAVGDNGVGVAGVNWHVSLMPLEICTATSCDLSAEISAIQYAVAHGAKIINASFGGGCEDCLGDPAERDAIAAAGQAGVLYVAAAGNQSADNDFVPFFPASWPLDNVISVAATTESGDLAFFSDYGDTVQMAAPGTNIYSTALTSGYASGSGTSAAAPQVSGAAALLWAEHPSWTMQQVRMRLLTTASPLVSLGGPVADCGQLNVDAATDPAVSDRGIVCVHLGGTGSGTVTSNPAAITCGTTCGESVAAGTQVVLTATPASDSTFLGWTGACSGVGTCTVNAAGVTQVRATFRGPGTPAGWQQHRLASPDGLNSFPPGTSTDYSFFNVAVSADGGERAKAMFLRPASTCSYGDNNGGVFLERHTAEGWVDDGEVSPPASVNGVNGDWTHCGYWGNLTQLSADGSTLLVAPQMSPALDASGNLRYRCGAFVYQRVSGSWNLDTVLFPPGVDANGSSTSDACGYFGIDGAMSADGSRVAMLTDAPDGTGQTVISVDVYRKSLGVWGLEQTIAVPSPNQYCGYGVPERGLSLSGDGASLFVGSTECADGGFQHAGLTYAYTRSGTQWTLAQTIHSPAPGPEQRFGNETALSQDGNTAVITSVAGYSWVFERGLSGWQMSTQLGQPSIDPLFCPLVVEGGARVICSAWDTAKFNYEQGLVYVYDRPAGGWASQPQTQQPLGMFATDGRAGDRLGQANIDKWPTIAGPEDGSFVDAPIAMRNLASGASPHDRIGYEFTTGAVDKTLTVHASGAGFGSVHSSIAGISCGAVCFHDYADGTSVTLTATPTNGATFGGWTGDCSGTGNCTVTMAADHSVTATFIPPPPPPQLTVTTSGTGGGNVTSSPAGIDCPSSCKAGYASGTTVQLTAAPDLGSSFDGWSGACSGTGNCSVSMTQARNVTATFTAHPPVTVTVSRLGSGKILGSPTGINCGSVCSHAYPYGSLISLHAIPASGFLFAGWTGACAGAIASCNLRLTTAVVTAAKFGVPKLLTVAKLGTGSGVVKSNPGGISCPSACKYSFGAGAVVTLTATAKVGSTFTGWSGACSGTGNCVVKMSAAKTVKATFAHHSAVRGTSSSHRHFGLFAFLRGVVSLLTLAPRG